mgnify:CR=1 FL=1
MKNNFRGWAVVAGFVVSEGVVVTQVWLCFVAGSACLPERRHAQE